MREAEIKHGRVAMLATAGWLAVDFGFKLPGAPRGAARDTPITPSRAPAGVLRRPHARRAARAAQATSTRA